MEEKITGDLDWNIPEVCTSLVQGADAKAIYDSLEGNMKSAVSYDQKTRLLTGSNVFVAARIDTLLKPLGMRVANVRDLSRPEVMEIVKQKIKIKIDDQEKEAEYRTFSTGKKGYGCYGMINIDGQSFRLSLNLIQM